LSFRLKEDLLNKEKLTDSETPFPAIVLIVITVALASYEDRISLFLEKLEYALLNSVLPILLLVLLIVAIIILLISLVKHLKLLKRERNEIASEKRHIENILDQELLYSDITIEDDITLINLGIEAANTYPRLKKFLPELKEKLRTAKRMQHQIKEDEIVDEREKRKNEIAWEVRRLKEERRRLDFNEERRKQKILSGLENDINNVLIKKNLTEEQIKVLLEAEYVQVNEFDIIEKKIIPVFIKKVLKHSPSHIFLVWSARRFLETIKGIGRIEENLTRDADLVFDYNKERYAIEVETGTLLEKKKQLESKVKYMNDIYPDRWIFLVTNRNLVPKYRKYGPTTQRINLEKNLKKMLKIDIRN